MKLSIVIPFYKELDLIDRAVRSALAQASALGTCEVVIGNDGTIPNPEILARITPEWRDLTRIVTNEGPHGPGGARNAALQACNGDLIAFLDADDYWLPGKLPAQMDRIEQGATFVATGYLFDTGGSLTRPPARIDTARDVFLKRGIGTSTVLVTRSLLAEHRFRDIRFAQDIDFWYRLASSPAFRYAAVEDGYVAYSTGGSTRNKLVQLGYVARVLKLNHIGPALAVRILFSYSFSGIFRHYLKPLPGKLANLRDR